MTVFFIKASETNIIPEEYQGPQLSWGLETNGLVAGLVWEETTLGGSEKQTVNVLILTFKTNVLQKYVKPPGEKVEQIELRNAEGILITPIHENRLVAELPKTILSKDLPMTPKFGRNNSLPKDVLILSQNRAVSLAKFVSEKPQHTAM